MEHLKTETHQKTKNKSRPISEARKIRKPLMERKRRERINTSLNELARLLVEAKKVDADGGKASKLEKADILELTVTHLQSIHNSGSTNKGEPVSPEAEEKFSQGFSECMKVVERILKRSTTDSLRERLLSHLTSKLKIMKSSKKVSAVKESIQNSDEEQRVTIASDKKNGFVEDCSFENLTLVPTELPGGEVAFILKGDTKKLLKEWTNFPNGNKFSSFKEKEICQKEIDSKCRISSFPTKENSSTPLLSFQTDNTCFQQSLSKRETDSVNPSCESKNNLHISVQRTSSSPLNTSSNSIQEFPSPSLSKNTTLTDIDKENYLYPSISPTESLNNFSLDGQTSCLSDAYYSGSETYVVSNYSTHTNHANADSSPIIPSISHASINHFDQNQNSCNHISNLGRNCSGLSSSGSSQQQRLPHKAHCPPTPPPSPPSGAEHRRSSNACLINPENRLVHEAEIDIDLDQPFDLSMNKMWRPW